MEIISLSAGSIQDNNENAIHHLRSVKHPRGEAKVTLPKAYCISLHVTPLCEHTLLLHE
jgi:hypothetical protein